MKKAIRWISLILIICLFLNNVSFSVYAYAEEKKSSNCVEINGKTFSEKEFEELLEQAIKVDEEERSDFLFSKNQSKLRSGGETISAAVIPAWAIGEWVVPFIGTVLITYSEVIVNEVIEPIGSWIYDKVMSFIDRIGSKGKDYKKLSESELKRHGIDPHKLKRDYVGPNGAKYNIYVDKKTGQILLIDKDGNVIETSEYIEIRN